MARYVVMKPPGARSEESIRASILRDGFHVLAFLVPPLWLLWNRLWIEAALVVAVMLGLGVLTQTENFGWAGSALSLLVSFYVGLESTALRIAALQRRGWSEVMAIEADSLADAEIRHASSVATGSEVLADIPWRTASMDRGPKDRPALGLLNYPGQS